MTLEQASKDFAAALLALATAVAESVTPTATTAKPRKEKTSTKDEAAPAKVEGPTAKQVADAILDLAETNRDTAKAILGKFQANRVSELKPADYAEVLKLATEAKAAPATVANDSLV